MFVVNGIVYAGEPREELKVSDASLIDDFYMLLTFSSGERRVFDGKKLLEYPAFFPLTNQKIFDGFKINRGILTWQDGEIDIAPEKLYEMSWPYFDEPACDLHTYSSLQ